MGWHSLWCEFITADVKYIIKSSEQHIITTAQTATFIFALITQINRDTMTDKLLNIPNDDAQNYLFCKIKLLVKTFGHSTE